MKYAKKHAIITLPSAFLIDPDRAHRKSNGGSKMGKLIVFNFILIAFIVLGLWLAKKRVKRERTQSILLLCAAIFTILFHYSELLFALFSGGDAIACLKDTLNLILPIYPCNVVMWCALIFGALRSKRTRLGAFLADYLFWFGIVSTLVGMFANVDFIQNPTLADYGNFKSIAAHATLLFNVLLLPLFGYIKIDVKRCLTNIVLSILLMAAVGGYCNLLFSVLASPDTAYDINSMFLIHSPFEGLPFLTYPVIALCAVPIYFAVFAIADVCAHKKGERFFDKKKKSDPPV